MHAPFTSQELAQARFEKAEPPFGKIDSVGPWEEQLELDGGSRFLRVVMLLSGDKLIRTIFTVDFNCLGAPAESRFEVTKTGGETMAVRVD